jgi:hypothetical protein
MKRVRRARPICSDQGRSGYKIIEEFLLEAA